MASRIHIQLEIELGDPITGTVSDEVGRPHAFAGWLELTSAIEGVCEAAWCGEAPAGTRPGVLTEAAKGNRR